MRFSLICWRICLALLAPAVFLTVNLYLYPAVLGCSFPSPSSTQIQHQASDSTDSIAPFRLLVLADPQLEGDTSLPDHDAPLLPSVRHFLNKYHDYSIGLLDIRTLLTSLVIQDVPVLLASARKRIDLLGNDYYLAHIYRTLHWYTQPTHVTVLGDLLGSQWIPDDEFEHRGWRYWSRVFRHGLRVEDDVTADVPGGRREVLGSDEKWSRRIINIAGNHDVGYAGDLSEVRMERFERTFGRANWDVTFTLPVRALSRNETAVVEEQEDTTAAPSIRLLILNSMNLDGPCLSSSLQQQTYTHINNQFINGAPSVDDGTAFTLLFTHIPLHKPAGVCVDAPYFSYFHPPHNAEPSRVQENENNSSVGRVDDDAEVPLRPEVQNEEQQAGKGAEPSIDLGESEGNAEVGTHDAGPADKSSDVQQETAESVEQEAQQSQVEQDPSLAVGDIPEDLAAEQVNVPDNIEHQHTKEETKGTSHIPLSGTGTEHENPRLEDNDWKPPTVDSLSDIREIDILQLQQDHTEVDTIQASDESAKVEGTQELSGEEYEDIWAGTDEAASITFSSEETEQQQARLGNEDHESFKTDLTLHGDESGVPHQQQESTETTSASAESTADTASYHDQSIETLESPVPISTPTSLPQAPHMRTNYHVFHYGGIREQNHLSTASTGNILKGIFGMSATGGRKGLILTGHDHEGCDVVHYPQLSFSSSNTAPNNDIKANTQEAQAGTELLGEVEWKVSRTPDFHSSSFSPHLREITLRSMMGSYNGNAGLLSLWYDYEKMQWEYGFQTCALGVQHWWWAVHVLDLVIVIVVLIGVIARLVEKADRRKDASTVDDKSGLKTKIVDRRVRTDGKEDFTLAK